MMKKFLSPSSELLVTWESEQYSNMACLYGFSDDRMKIVENDDRLFLGFSDAAPNVVLSPDPFPCRRLYWSCSIREEEISTKPRVTSFQT